MNKYETIKISKHGYAQRVFCKDENQVLADTLGKNWMSMSNEELIQKLFRYFDQKYVDPDIVIMVVAVRMPLSVWMYYPECTPKSHKRVHNSNDPILKISDIEEDTPICIVPEFAGVANAGPLSAKGVYNSGIRYALKTFEKLRRMGAAPIDLIGCLPLGVYIDTELHFTLHSLAKHLTSAKTTDQWDMAISHFFAGNYPTISKIVQMYQQRKEEYAANLAKEKQARKAEVSELSETQKPNNQIRPEGDSFPGANGGG